MFDLICQTFFFVSCFYVLISMAADEKKYPAIKVLGTSAFSLMLIAVPIALLIAAIKYLIGA